MAFYDLREFIETVKGERHFREVSAKVDWNGELSGILRKAYTELGRPAILFTNIKDHENTFCKKLFTGGLASRKNFALALKLSPDTPVSDLVHTLRRRFSRTISPKKIDNAPVKENILKGDDIDLYQIPVPKWHPLDGGRYINTFGAVVTRDPDSGRHNLGVYRGMINGKNKIGVNLVGAAHWGVDYSKYKELGKPMPVALVYGWDPAMQIVATTPLPSLVVSEYETIGSVREAPVELVKCETVDIEVPASAEIVIEGFISPDPSTYEFEGPFGEWPGYYGEKKKRPVIQVSCITHRNDPIFQGVLEGMKPGIISEGGYMGFIDYTALLFNVLESQGIPGVIDVVPGPITAVKIHKTYRGQAKQIAAALWGSTIAINWVKILMVVDEDVDIHNPRALQIAFMNKVDPKTNLIVYPDTPGNSLDPSSSSEDKDDVTYGAAKQNRLLIDATINWDTHPVRKEWGNRRYPPMCTDIDPEVEALVERRWKEYGLI
jgi:UbiD family decarboxylase